MHGSRADVAVLVRVHRRLDALGLDRHSHFDWCEFGTPLPVIKVLPFLSLLWLKSE
jgi:hypothetical protein